MDPTEAALATLGAAHEHAAEGRKAAEQLLQLVRDQQQPASVETITLTQGQPLQRSEARDLSLSFGVLNPRDAIVLVGIAGGSARPGSRAIEVPPLSLLVLPIAGEDFELGADTTNAATAATLAAGDLVVTFLRFKTVQPAHLGSVR